VCVCSLSHPACDAHAPYCRLWPAPLYFFPSTLSLELHDFKEKVIEHKVCVMIFSTILVRNISLFKKKTERNIIINVHMSSYNVSSGAKCHLPVPRWAAQHVTGDVFWGGEPHHTSWSADSGIPKQVRSAVWQHER